MTPRPPMLRNGIYVFSYRPIERWERKLLIDNSYYNGNHQLTTKPILLHVNRRIHNTIEVNKEFKAHYVKDWFIYEYQQELNQIFPREYTWMNIEAPNQSSFTTYIPDIINSGDTIMFDTPTPKHLN